MAEGKFVAYYRVSTARQERSGLGLEGQKDAVERFLNGGAWQLVASFTETESGGNNQRPELTKAIAACRVYGAKLVIAKLDRLSRDVHFLTGLEKAGIEFVCCDMEGANRTTVRLMSVIAEAEREMISARTKAALAAAKARGTKLGGYRGKGGLTKESSVVGRQARTEIAKTRAEQLKPVFTEIWQAGHESLGSIARELTSRGVPTARGKTSTWTAQQVKRVLDRLAS